MKHLTRTPARVLVALMLGTAASVAGAHPATAGEATVQLGTVGSYAVLAASTVTNTGPTTVSGNLGVSPGTAITGFPPGTVSNGTTHAGDAHAASAQAALTTAYNDAAGRSSSGAIAADLGGKTLVGGVYTGGAVLLTGRLTLDGEGDPDAVFIFQASSTLKTASASEVRLVGDARACNVFWQVGSSATLGTSSDFVGTILAQASVTVGTGVSVEGRLLARSGAVTLDADDIERTGCAATSPSTSTTTSPATTTTATTTVTSTSSSTTSTSSSTTTTTGAGASTATSSTTTTAPSSGAGNPSEPVDGDGVDVPSTSTDPFGPGGTERTAPGNGAVVAGDDAGLAVSDASDAPLTTLPRTGLPLGAMSVLAALLVVAGFGLVHAGQRRLLPPIARLRRLAG